MQSDIDTIKQMLRSLWSAYQQSKLECDEARAIQQDLQNTLDEEQVLPKNENNPLFCIDFINR